MKNKLLPLYILTIAILLNVGAFVLRSPLEFGFCEKIYTFNGYDGCLDKIDLEIGEPLQIYALALFVISVALFFVDKKVFLSWAKFGAVWTFLTAIFVYKSPTYGHPFFPIEKGTVSLFMAVLFILISLILIIYGSRRSSKQVNS
jgi:hypothetical protein